jgi:hypothetical protein
MTETEKTVAEDKAQAGADNKKKIIKIVVIAAIVILGYWIVRKYIIK